MGLPGRVATCWPLLVLPTPRGPATHPLEATCAIGNLRPLTVCPSSALGKAGLSTARIRFWQRRKLWIWK